MNPVNKIVFFLIFTFLFNVNAHSNNKVVFIDIQYAVNNSNIGKKVIEDINKIQNDETNKLKLIEESLKKKDNEIKKVKNIISKDELESKISILKKEINSYNLKKEEIQKKFTIDKNLKLDELIKKINPLITKFMEDNSIELILSKKIVYLGKTELDITNEIVELINNNYK